MKFEKEKINMLLEEGFDLMTFASENKLLCPKDR